MLLVCAIELRSPFGTDDADLTAQMLPAKASLEARVGLADPLRGLQQLAGVFSTFFARIFGVFHSPFRASLERVT